MRLLIATGLYPPDIGGPATYTKFLERHLPSNGHSVTVVAFTHVRKYPKVVRHLVYLIRLLQEGRHVDMLYALDTISVGVPVLVASVLLRKPYYLRVPGDYAWEQGQQRYGVHVTLDEYLHTNKKPFFVRMLAWMQSRVARSATRVIVPSEYMRGVVMKWGVRPEKITRIYSALNPITITRSREELREQYGYKGFTVITAARLTPWKGIEAVIAVVHDLHQQGVPISLEIVGEGEERQHLTHCITQAGASAYIHLRGQVDKQELAERIKGTDAFVLNTSYEGLSHQLLEVMMIGVPIVTTNAGGNAELIEDTREGLIVPWNNMRALQNALVSIKDDQVLATAVVTAARTKVRAFEEEHILPEILALFEGAK